MSLLAVLVVLGVLTERARRKVTPVALDYSHSDQAEIDEWQYDPYSGQPAREPDELTGMPPDHPVFGDEAVSGDV